MIRESFQFAAQDMYKPARSLRLVQRPMPLSDATEKALMRAKDLITVEES